MDMNALVNAQLGKLLRHDGLVVGGYNVKLSGFPSEEGAGKDEVSHGCNDERTLTLRLPRDLPSLDHLGVSFLRELHRAVSYVFGSDGSGAHEDETIVIGLWQVFCDNPWVLPWLSECQRYEAMLGALFASRSRCELPAE
jgi:hypothetical protein